MLSALMRFKKSGLGSLFGLGLMLSSLPLSAGAQSPVLQTSPSAVQTQDELAQSAPQDQVLADDEQYLPSVEADVLTNELIEPSPGAEATDSELSADESDEASAEVVGPSAQDTTEPSTEESTEFPEDEMAEPFDDIGELPDEALPETPAEPEITGDDTADACAVRKTREVNFTDAEAADTLTIDIGDGPCLEARVSLTVTRADGIPVYHFAAPLIEVVPELIYEPAVAQLMSSYVDRALHRALLRTTGDLPEYAEVAHYYESTGEFVVVDQARYEALRQQNVPILWHKTGESTWVHVIYDSLTLTSQVIMEGRTF